MNFGKMFILGCLLKQLEQDGNMIMLEEILKVDYDDNAIFLQTENNMYEMNYEQAEEYSSAKEIKDKWFKTEREVEEVF